MVKIYKKAYTGAVFLQNLGGECIYQLKECFMQEKEEKKVSFKDTLNLPRTDFPIRSNAKEDDPSMLERWQKENLSRQTFELNKGQDQFILHDGPPYANGHLHLGHAYNKILKDIVCKSQRMFGKHAPVTPGWDCHGLPIEIKVTQEHIGLSRSELKTKCREYAAKWVGIQRDEFKRLGVLMDWDRPYLTMNFSYEASILRAFGKFVADGYIEHKNKTVPWCSSCKTVLATAEIEYQDRKDPSIYVQFQLEEAYSKKLFPQLDRPVSLLIWTTTPWTLPLNRAIVIKPDADYVVLDINDKLVIVGKTLADKLCNAMKVEKKVIAEFPSKKLAGLKAHHPFVPNLMVPILYDPFVALDEGTACVHSAPGCGPEDYEIALKNNLEIFSPLSSDGLYTEGIEPKELEGMPITDGQIWVLKKLVELEKLLFKTTIRHSYPHCWRCHNPLMFRATKQWFCDLSKENLKKRALLACETIKTIPLKSVDRLKATIDGRLEWCISRQRVWGVPITALLCTDCDTPFIDQALVEKVAEQVEKEGVEYWDEVDHKKLIPKDLHCSKCHGMTFKKETDILDVWFDAGISHFAVLRNNPELGFPADMYLEGKDQHRGWFQSSLLTGLVLEGISPTKMLVTHGFTVDQQGRKMSKSLGNTISPDQMIETLGTDGLRLWAASIDVQGEAIVSDVLIKNVQQVFRKIRNTCRFLLSNLYDYDEKKDAIPLEKLLPIDRYGLIKLQEVQQTILEAYQAYDFTAVFHALADYCSVELSSFYLDIVKDRLYVEKANGLKRRSAQTVCWHILDSLTRLIAPILSFTAEQVSDHSQKDKDKSIHLQPFAAPIDNLIFNHEDELCWDMLKGIRSAILKAIEIQREKDVLKHSLEASVKVYFNMEKESIVPLAGFYKQLEKANQDVIAFFKEFLIVSQFEIIPVDTGLESSEFPGLHIKVERAIGNKCPRCWQWEKTTHEHGLCSRCYHVLR